MFIFEESTNNQTNLVVDEREFDISTGAIEIANEATEGFSKLLEAIAIQDVMEYSYSIKGDSAKATAISEASFKGFIEGAKSVFIKMKNAVVKFFQDVYNKFKDFFTKGEEFVKKYKSQIEEKANKGDFKDFSYTGFKWTNLDTSIPSVIKAPQFSDVGAIKDKLSSEDIGSEELKNSIIRDYMKKLCENENVQNTSDFRKVLYMSFRNNETSPVKIQFSEIKLDELFKAVTATGDTLTKLKALEGATTESFDKSINTLKTLENVPEEDKKYVKDAISITKSLKVVANTSIQEFTKAIKDRSSEYNNVLHKMLTFNPKKAKEDAVSESYMLCSEAVVLGFAE